MAIIQPHPTIRPIIVARASIGDELLAQAKREAHEINTSKVEGHLKDSYKEGAGMEAGLKAELVCQQELCLKRQEGDGKYNNDLKEINGESQYEVKTKQRLFSAKHHYDGAVAQQSFETQHAENYIFCNNVYEDKDTNNKGHYEYDNLKAVEIIGVISRKDFEDYMDRKKDFVVWDNNEEKIVNSPIVRFVEKHGFDPLDPTARNNFNQYKIRYSEVTPMRNLTYLIREPFFV